MKSDYLRPELYQKLEKYMQPENILALRVSLETGLRIDDVLSLKWDSFISSRTFKYIAKKTKKEGKKSISPQLMRDICLKCNKNSEFVFAGRDPQKHRTRQAVWRDIKNARSRLGLIENASPHSARKTYAVELRKAKGLDAVQTELQHTDLTTTMLYAFSDIVKSTISAPKPKSSEGAPSRLCLDRATLQYLCDEISKKIISELRIFVTNEIIPEIKQKK